MEDADIGGTSVSSGTAYRDTLWTGGLRGVGGGEGRVGAGKQARGKIGPLFDQGGVLGEPSHYSLNSYYCAYFRFYYVN